MAIQIHDDLMTLQIDGKTISEARRLPGGWCLGSIARSRACVRVQLQRLARLRLRRRGGLGP
jgi:hypothetical protein